MKISKLLYHMRNGNKSKNLHYALVREVEVMRNPNMGLDHLQKLISSYLWYAQL